MSPWVLRVSRVKAGFAAGVIGACAALPAMTVDAASILLPATDISTVSKIVGFAGFIVSFASRPSFGIRMAPRIPQPRGLFPKGVPNHPISGALRQPTDKALAW